MIQGKRVCLRPPKKSDIDHFMTWLNDPKVIDYLLLYRPITRLAEEKWYEQIVSSPNDIIFIIETTDGTSIGNIALHKINHREQHAELGIVIGDKSYWGKGYGTEAIRLLCKYGFEQLNLQRIYLHVRADNERGRRCYQKVGFIQEGCLRHHTFKNGRFYDLIVMGLLRSEFIANSH